MQFTWSEFCFRNSICLPLMISLGILSLGASVATGQSNSSLPPSTLPPSTLPTMNLPSGQPDNALPNNTLPKVVSPQDNRLPDNRGVFTPESAPPVVQEKQGTGAPANLPNPLPTGQPGQTGGRPTQALPNQISNSTFGGNDLPPIGKLPSNNDFPKTEGQPTTPPFSFSDSTSNGQSNLNPSSRQNQLDAQLRNNQLRGNPVSNGNYERFSAQNPANGVTPVNPANHTGSKFPPITKSAPQDHQPQFNNLQQVRTIPTQVENHDAIQPVNFNASSTNTQLNLNGSLAKQMLRRMDINQIEGVLPGEPIGMVTLMQSVEPRKRHDAAAAYWNCFAAWANLSCAQREQMILQQLPMPQSQHEQTMLKTALGLADTRIEQAEARLKKTQRALSKFVSTQHPDILPLSKDLPLVGSYRTRYEALSQNRSLPGVAGQLHQELPRQKQLIDSNARLIQQSELAVRQSQQAFSAGQATVASVLESIRLLHQSNEQFVEAVVNYNQSTSDYAFAVSSPFQAGQTVAAMLIPLKQSVEAVPSRIANASSVLQSGNVITTGGIEYQPNQPTRVADRGNVTPVTAEVNPNRWQNQGNLNPPTRVGQLPPSNNRGGQFGGYQR